MSRNEQLHLLLLQNLLETEILLNKKLEDLKNDEAQCQRMKEALMRQQEEYMREFMNKEVINVSKTAHLEAVIFLKEKGWTGKALIHHEEFADELAKYDIPYTPEDL